MGIQLVDPDELISFRRAPSLRSLDDSTLRHLSTIANSLETPAEAEEAIFLARALTKSLRDSYVPLEGPKPAMGNRPRP